MILLLLVAIVGLLPIYLRNSLLQSSGREEILKKNAGHVTFSGMARYIV